MYTHKINKRFPFSKMETVITYNYESNIATIRTNDFFTAKMLDALTLKSNEIISLHSDTFDKIYELPKSWIIIKKIPNLSEKRVKELSDHMRKIGKKNLK